MSKFKIGDRVKHATLNAFVNGDKIRTIKRFGVGYDTVWFEETDTWLHTSEIELAYLTPPATPNPPHVHHDLIVAWANGSQIQFKSGMSNGWVDCFPNNPQWIKSNEYRIKPEKSDRDLEIESIQNQINELQTRLDSLKKVGS